MIWITHLVFGLLCGILFKGYVHLNIWYYYPIVLFAALLPDIDHPDSKVGNKFGFFSKFIEKTFGHRGLFHTIYIAILFAWLISLFFAKQYAYAFFIGYVSHLFIDGFTKMGINFLHPLSTLRLHGFVETRSTMEYLLLICFGILVVYLIV